MSDLPIKDLAPIDIWDASPDGLLLVDVAGVIRAANDQAHALFGITDPDLVGMSVEALVPTDIAATHAALRAGFTDAPRRRPMGAGRGLSARRGDLTFPVSIALSPLGHGDLTLAAIRDMSEHDAVEQRLVEATRRRLLAEDHERIARDLHDTVIQELFALGMSLQATLPFVTDDEVARRIDGSVSTLDEVIRSIRTLIFDMASGPSRDNTGLRARLVQIAATFTPSLGFEPSVTFRGPIDTGVPARLHDHCCAVVREGLANVARHAEAFAATCSVTISDDVVTIRVSDDGRGLPETAGRRSGLANLVDRAIEVDGTCEVTGDPDGGTMLRWAAPVD